MIYKSEHSWFQLNRFLWVWNWEISLKEDDVDLYAWYTSKEIEKLKISFDNRKVLDLLVKKSLID